MHTRAHLHHGRRGRRSRHSAGCSQLGLEMRAAAVRVDRAAAHGVRRSSPVCTRTEARTQTHTCAHKSARTHTHASMHARTRMHAHPRTPESRDRHVALLVARRCGDHHPLRARAAVELRVLDRVLRDRKPAVPHWRTHLLHTRPHTGCARTRGCARVHARMEHRQHERACRALSHAQCRRHGRHRRACPKRHTPRRSARKRARADASSATARAPTC